MFTDVAAQKIAVDLFGFHGVVARLPGEYDHNFHLKAENGSEYLLKVSHSEELASTIDMQNKALQTLKAAELPFAIPELQPNLYGEWVSVLEDTPCHKVRLFSYVPGNLFAQAKPYSMKLLCSLGTQMAHLSVALSDFKHQQALRYSKWDLKQSHWIGEQLHLIPNDEERRYISKFSQFFAEEKLPLLSGLRHSVIHGDINDYNIIVKENRVSGFIDFGDLIETSTVCELAIALTYAIMGHAEPLSCAALILNAYHQVMPLTEAEVEVLLSLIIMRLCTSLVNSALRQREDPQDPYLIISEKPARQLLSYLKQINENQAINVFKTACGMPL